MGRIVQVPLLMADGVAFAEYRNDEIEAALAKDLALDPPLGADALHQPVEQRAILFERAQLAGAMHIVVGGKFPRRIAVDPEHRMQTERRVDVGCGFRRPGAEAEMAVVTAPFRQLETVDRRARLQVRHVERRDLAPGIAQRMPERHILAARPGEPAQIGVDVDLVPAMKAVAIGAQTRRKTHPYRADEQPNRVPQFASRRAIEQPPQRRQLPFHREAVRDRGIARVEPDDHDGTALSHRLFFARTARLSAANVGPWLSRFGASVP